jgi:hypothetical protein
MANRHCLLHRHFRYHRLHYYRRHLHHCRCRHHLHPRLHYLTRPQWRRHHQTSLHHRCLRQLLLLVPLLERTACLSRRVEFQRRRFARLLHSGTFCDDGECAARFHRACHRENAERKAESQTNEPFHSGGQPDEAETECQPLIISGIPSDFTDRGRHAMVARR